MDRTPPPPRAAAIDAQDLRKFAEVLKECAPYAEAEAVVDLLGIEGSDCFQKCQEKFSIVEEQDFINICKIKTIHARKLVTRIKALVAECSSTAVGPDLRTQPEEAFDLESRPRGLVAEEEDCDPSQSDDEFDISAEIAAMGDSGDDEHDLLLSSEKRQRNANRYGRKRSAQTLRLEMAGSKRMNLANKAARVTPGESGGRPGASSREIAGKSCRCSEKLDAIVPQLVGAVRTTPERKRRAGEAKQPGDVDKVGTYNLSRLATLVTPLFFDSLGNFMFHGVCIRKKFGFGNDWLSSAHRRAVSLSKVPVVKVKKESLPQVNDALLGRVVVPEGICVSPRDYLKSLEPQAFVSLVRNRSNFHGLSGAASNRMQVAARNFISAFTRQSSAPNGRTRDANGRFHGAPNYLDAKYLLYVQQRAGEERLAFADECLRCMKLTEPFLSNPRLLVKPRTIRAVLGELFGKIKFVHGMPVYNEEYTVLYPQKTDACSDCVRLSQQMSSDRQSLKRHEQQSDRGLDRMKAIQDLQVSLKDHERVMKEHRDEAARASSFHKKCVSTAYDSYNAVSEQWEALMTKGIAATEDDVTQFCSDASDLWLDVSTDYQQDKSLPSWKQSPQPGPTYYLSGVSNYVHIIVVESCGKPSGPLRFARNLVYIRDERVAGSKTSDDTLSTLADSLHSGKGPTAEQPSVFRCGYDSNGKVL